MQRRRRAVLTALAIVRLRGVRRAVGVGRPRRRDGGRRAARAGAGPPGTAAAALGWAVTGLLLVDPAWIDDAGFRLSVLATAGIIAWGSSLTERLAGPSPDGVRRWVAEILGVSLRRAGGDDADRAARVRAAVAGRAARSTSSSCRSSRRRWRRAPLRSSSACSSGLGLPSILATLVGLPAWALYAAMVGVVRLGAGAAARQPRARAAVGRRSARPCRSSLILAAARWGGRLLDGAEPARRRRRRGDRPRAAAGPRPASARRSEPRDIGARARRRDRARRRRSSGWRSSSRHRPDGVARVVVLDVGQGDGILVEGGRGGRMVVDGGPDPGRLLIALDERLPPWDRRIDVLVLTHPHEDHVAGLALLLERYRVGRVYEPGMLGPGPGYAAWASVLADGGPPHGRLSTGDRLTLDAIRFRVLWPDANRVPERPTGRGTAINNVSIVLLGEVAGQRFLLAGDIEEGVDPELLARGLPPVDLLKVAHHGSRTATTPAVPRGRPAERRRRVGGRRQSLRAPGAGDARAAARARGPDVSNGYGRRGRGRVRRATGFASGRAGLGREAASRRPTPARPLRRPVACGGLVAPAAAFLCGIAARDAGFARPRPRRRQAADRPRGAAVAAARRRRSPARAPRRSAPSLGRLPDPKIGARTPSLPSTRCRPPRPRRPRRRRGTAPLAYFWGDDAYGLEAALDAFRNDPRRFPDGPPERWRPEAERTEPARLLGEIRERLATGSMFGGGSVAILRGAGGLIRSNDGTRRSCSARSRRSRRATAWRSSRRPSRGRRTRRARRWRTRSGAPAARSGWLKAPREGELAAWIERARPRARDQARAGRRARARDPRRRLRARGRRRAPAPGPDRGHGAGEAHAPARGRRAGHGRRRPGARRRGGARARCGRSSTPSRCASAPARSSSSNASSRTSRRRCSSRCCTAGSAS